MLDVILLLALLILAGLALYLFFTGQLFACGSCAMTTGDLKELKDLANSCTRGLRAVVREDMVSSNDVEDFIIGGKERMVIITNVNPEDFIAMIEAGQAPNINMVKAVVIMPTTINSVQNYLVLSGDSTGIKQVGKPTDAFITAFGTFETTARKELGPDTENLVFYIDQAICAEETPLVPLVPVPEETPLVPLVPAPEEIERCCGRRF